LPQFFILIISSLLNAVPATGAFFHRGGGGLRGDRGTAAKGESFGGARHPSAARKGATGGTSATATARAAGATAAAAAAGGGAAAAGAQSRAAMAAADDADKRRASA
jgi:hypothetical protein